MYSKTNIGNHWTAHAWHIFASFGDLGNDEKKNSLRGKWWNSRRMVQEWEEKKFVEMIRGPGTRVRSNGRKSVERKRTEIQAMAIACYSAVEVEIVNLFDEFGSFFSYRIYIVIHSEWIDWFDFGFEFYRLWYDAYEQRRSDYFFFFFFNASNLFIGTHNAIGIRAFRNMCQLCNIIVFMERCIFCIMSLHIFICRSQMSPFERKTDFIIGPLRQNHWPESFYSHNRKILWSQ